MKKIIKKLTLFLMLLLPALIARTQYSSVMAYDGTIPDGGATIVRNMSSTEVVTYYKSSNYHRFTYESSSTLTYNYFDLPSPAYLSNFAYLIPYQTAAYSSVFVHDDSWLFQSVTNLDDYFFVGAGGAPFHLFLRDASASYPANNIYSGTPVLCPEDDVLKVA